MKENQLQVIVKENGLTGDKAKELLDAFGAPFEEAGEILATYKTIAVSDINDVDSMQLAREKRLVLKRVRTGVENTRKDMKSDYIKAGRVIDAVAGYVKDTIKPAEDYLQLQEDFALITAQKAKNDLINARKHELWQYTQDIEAYNLEMPDDQYQIILDGVKRRYAEAKEQERITANRIERERQEEIARQQAIADENVRLKAEAEEAAKIQAKKDEQKRQRVGQVTNIGMRRQLDGIWSQPGIADTFTDDEVENLPIDQLTARCNAITNIVYEQNMKAQAERKAEKQRLAQLEADEQARKVAEEAEIKATAEKLFNEQKAQTAPDKEKLLAFANSLANWQIYGQITPVTQPGIVALEKANTHILKVVDFLRAEADKL